MIALRSQLTPRQNFPPNRVFPPTPQQTRPETVHNDSDWSADRLNDAVDEQDTKFSTEELKERIARNAAMSNSITLNFLASAEANELPARMRFPVNTLAFTHTSRFGAKHHAFEADENETLPQDYERLEVSRLVV